MSRTRNGLRRQYRKKNKSDNNDDDDNNQNNLSDGFNRQNWLLLFVSNRRLNDFTFV